MRSSRLLWALAVVGMVCAAGGVAWGRPGRVPAFDAEDVAQRCIAQVYDAADRTCRQIDRATSRVVQEMTALLEAGEVEEVRTWAAIGQRRINVASRVSVRAIEMSCQWCEGMLSRVGRADLAEQVEQAGEDAIAQITAAAGAAVAEIQAAAEGDGGGDYPPE